MTIEHHLSDDILLEYAAGDLAEGWSLAVATHLALCPACRKRLAVMESAAGLLLEAAPFEATAVDMDWQGMKARIAMPGPRHDGSVPVRTAKAQAPILPEPIRSRLGGDVADLRWRPLGRGAFHVPLPTTDGETRVRLLKIPAGQPVPEHSHGGRELTLVLSGSFYDGDGKFRRGDIEEADETLSHQPVAGKDEDCICLAVTDAPLKFRSWLLRLVQPVLGI